MLLESRREFSSSYVLRRLCLFTMMICYRMYTAMLIALMTFVPILAAVLSFVCIFFDTISIRWDTNKHSNIHRSLML